MWVVVYSVAITVRPVGINQFVWLNPMPNSISQELMECRVTPIRWKVKVKVVVADTDNGQLLIISPQPQRLGLLLSQFCTATSQVIQHNQELDTALLVAKPDHQR